LIKKKIIRIFRKNFQKLSNPNCPESISNQARNYFSTRFVEERRRITERREGGRKEEDRSFTHNRKKKQNKEDQLPSRRRRFEEILDYHPSRTTLFRWKDVSNIFPIHPVHRASGGKGLGIISTGCCNIICVVVVKMAP
jgi:hypothetical protein